MVEQIITNQQWKPAFYLVLLLILIIIINSCTLLMYQTEIIDGYDYVCVFSNKEDIEKDFLIIFVGDKETFINWILYKSKNPKRLYVFVGDSEKKLQDILKTHKIQYKTIIAKVDGKYYLKYRIKSNFKIDSREYLDVFVSEEKIEFMSAYRFTK